MVHDGRLIPADFQFAINAVDPSGAQIERRTLQCRARVCRSLITLDRDQIDAGDVRIGSTMERQFTVR